MPNRISNHYTEHNKVSLLKSGKPYFQALIELIDSAKHEFHLQVYIFEPDETGFMVKEALIRAASRQVKIFLLVDGFGSGSLSSSFISEMKEAGINFRWFGPLFSGMSLHIGRRMHHKVAVADCKAALVGGINIGNRYNEIHGEPPWFDFALRVEGEIAFQLHAFCLKKWKGIRVPGRNKFLKDLHAMHAELVENHCKVRIRVNDRLNRFARIVYSYRNAIRNAHENVIIVGAYFIPGNRFIRLMNKASKRGVKIRLITGMQSDVWLAQHALHYLYRKLIRNNITIYEYKKAPVHGKALVADKQFVSLGSYDLNQLSSFINLELNLDVDDPEFGDSFHSLLEKTIADDCIPITPKLLREREHPFTMLKQWTAYRLLRILFFVTLFVSNKSGT